MDYSYRGDDGNICEEKLLIGAKRMPRNPSIYYHKRPIPFGELQTLDEHMDRFVKAELMIEALKFEGILTDALRQEVAQKVESKMKIQYCTIYEHPWLHKWGGFLKDLNKDVHNKAHYMAMALTFKLVCQIAMNHYFGAIFTGSMIATCFLAGHNGVNPIGVTVAKIELVRMVQEGKNDPVAQIVTVENLYGSSWVLHSHLLKILDPSSVKKTQTTMLKHLISKFYPVWVGPVVFRVLKNGRIFDQELFKAVLSGNRINLTKTVEHENAASLKAEREALQRAQLNEEIKEMLKKRRKTTASLNDSVSQPLQQSC